MTKFETDILLGYITTKNRFYYSFFGESNEDQKNVVRFKKLYILQNKSYKEYQQTKPWCICNVLTIILFFWTAIDKPKKVNCSVFLSA